MGGGTGRASTPFSVGPRFAAGSIGNSKAEIIGRCMRIEPPAGEFNLSRLERVIYGPGKVAALKEEMERRNLHRALVVTTDVVAELPIMAQVTGALDGRCAGVFAGVVMHVPRKTTEALQQEIERVNADCVVSFGGGSPIDSCKAAAPAVTQLAPNAPLRPSAPARTRQRDVPGRNGPARTAARRTARPASAPRRSPGP
jgi:Iron-containing alcohol dehydrogenase